MGPIATGGNLFMDLAFFLHVFQVLSLPSWYTQFTIASG